MSRVINLPEISNFSYGQVGLEFKFVLIIRAEIRGKLYRDFDIARHSFEISLAEIHNPLPPIRALSFPVTRS